MKKHEAELARKRFHKLVVNNDPETDESVEWMKSIGTPFVAVRFALPGGGWVGEDHVDDEATLEATIDMAAARLGAKAAVWEKDGKSMFWAFRKPVGSSTEWEKPRIMPTREAAEMLAIHAR